MAAAAASLPATPPIFPGVLNPAVVGTSPRMEITDPSAPNQLLEPQINDQAYKVLNELRGKGDLCDAVLRVDDGQFPIHRVVMSACSPYFRSLFTNGMHETRYKEIYIPELTADLLEIMIDYAYTKKAEVTTENIERLLPAADHFHVFGLVKLCCDFLSKGLDSENCIGIRDFARAFFCNTLADKAHRFVLEHFSEIALASNELLCLNDEQMVEILSADDLNVKNEETVFECIIRWINHAPDKRKNFTAKLLRCARLGLLTTQYFVETVKIYLELPPDDKSNKVKKHALIQDNEQCKPIVIETLKLLYDLDMEDTKEIDMSNPLSKPRIPFEIMFVVGGWSGGTPTNIIESYDTRADRWVTIDNPDRGPRAYHGCATVGGLIYLVGGFDGMDYFNSVRCFNPVTKIWGEVSPMHAKRCYVSVAVLDGCIYAMGGFDGHVRQNTAEKYDPSTNQWSLIAPMNHQRSDASATTLNGRVYICGGFNGQECLSSAEHYDPLTNQWSVIQPMRNRRSGIGVIAHDGCVFAIGGFNGITRMNNGEKYNPANNTWTNITEMYSPRSNFGIEVIDDLIFAIGGFNGVTTIFNVECYDTQHDEWYDCTDMNIYRSALSACVVRGLPNVADYIHKDRNKSEEKKKRAT